MARSPRSRDSSSSPDGVDELLAQWRRERPELALEAMGLFSRLGRVTAHVGRAIEARLADHGLTVADFDVLAALRRSGDPFELRPSDISRSLMLSPAGMTSRLDRLETAGHLERHLDPLDRRSFIVRLTKGGRMLVDGAVTDHVINEERLLGALTPSQRTELDHLLRTLLATFEP
jgi:DNA-binding MarR family transcriptional regulator